MIIIRLKYENKFGSVVFDGSGNKIGCKITKITGLGIPKKSYKTIEFASENGVTQVSEKDMQRTITITAEVIGDKQYCGKINRVFHDEGSLYITSDNLRRKIICKCTQPPEFTRLCQGIYTFVVQLQSDYPYFTEFYNINYPIFKLENIVTEEFTLPCVFTSRVARGNINNTGDKKVYPEIIITNNSSANESTDSNVIIENHTTGTKIVINHSLISGEVVTIKLAERKITSNLSGNITDKIDRNTILSDFYIDVGVNDISFYCSDKSNQDLSAIIVYSPEYYSIEV